MCDCVPSTLPNSPCIKIRNSGFARFKWGPRTLPIRGIVPQYYLDISNHGILGDSRVRNGGLQFISGSFGSNGADTKPTMSMNSVQVSRNSSASRSDEHEFYGELGFKEREENSLELEAGGNGEEKMKKKSSLKNGIDIGSGTTKLGDSRSSDAPDFPSVDFLEFDGKRGKKTARRFKDEDLVKIGRSDGGGLKLEESEKLYVRSGRQLMRRSNMIAKQVISMHSALSLGFVSQLWVDTNSWMVLIVEVRPNLLSGELERFLLEDISQVGDVVLIQDESVMENEFKMVGLETLVGYNVVTPGRRNIGKVRGYTFNINSGVVESLELDSFGISIIPSSLVSTYALFVEDVLEVVSDTVVVHEAAASRIQRVTKGFWDAQKVGNSIDELGEYSDPEGQPVQSDYARGRIRSGSRNSRPKMREIPDDWELPMDYL